MAKQIAVLYGRFSPRKNAETCESVESQLEDLRRYCMTNGIQGKLEFSDKALSGADEDRPGMWDAIHALKPGWILLVRDFTRLARDSTFALHIIRYEIEKKGCRIISITEPGASADTPDGRLVRTIMLGIGEYSREVTRARTRAAMRRHQKGGRRMSRHCPFGWKDDPKDKKRMVHEPKERELIAMIVSYYKQGKKLREISRMLIQAGARNRNGGPWHHYQVRRILEREGFPAGHRIDQTPVEELSVSNGGLGAEI